ncbi:MAG: hypothetical protein KQJ78_20190 [Deltaproteobacteria bacterium]|nr:hypothetical protein [Deltaproteobacteria bacterium]
MAQLWLRIDGQNFDNTIGDTDELSTLRGGSRALLELPGLLFTHLRDQKGYDLEPVYTGASEGLAQITLPAGDSEERLGEIEKTIREDVANFLRRSDTELNGIPAFLTLSCDVARAAGPENQDWAKLANRIRRQQFQKLTVDPLPSLGSSNLGRPCQWDLKRPAAVVEEKRSPEKPQGDSFAISASVKARFRPGRELRQKLYQRELGSEAIKDFRFANSFAEIVAQPPAGLPAKIANKMALLYLDGNKFGKLREHVGVRAFSEPVGEARKGLLAGLVDHLRGSIYSQKSIDRNGAEKTEKVMPFEILGWGGDESWMVLPAWEAVGLLLRLEKILSGPDWSLADGQDQKVPLTHALGLVLCHNKTPIREVFRLAKGLADDAKKCNPPDATRLRNVLQYQVLLGVDPPVNLACFRQALYGQNNPAAFTLGFGPCPTGERANIDSFEGLVSTLKKLKGPEDGQGIPYGRLLRLLQTGINQGLLFVGEENPGTWKDWSAKADEELSSYGCSALSELCAPRLGYGDAHPLMPLIHVVQLWEYVEPIPTGPRAKEGGHE